MTTTIAYTERQRIEQQYHDEKFSADGNDRASIPSGATRHFWQSIGQPQRQTILDFGCGDGWLSVRLAKLGNRVHAFDISKVLIARATELARKSNVADRISFSEMAAENLAYPDDHFDLVIGTSILHHTDLDVTLTRLRNVLKTTGRAVFIEPLNQNFALRAWRLVTPWRRSKTERALTRGDLALIHRTFPASQFRYFCFTSMFGEGLLLLAPGSRLLRNLSDRLAAFDDRLLATFPSLGRYSAVVVLELRK